MTSPADILVTGGGGSLASALRRCDPHRVRTAARATLDITDAASVDAALDAIRPRALINCAAYTRVDDAESHREEALRTNAYGARVVAEACAARAIPLIHISTDHVFGGRERLWREDDAPAPENHYGHTKAEGEAAIRAAGGNAVIARIAWLFDTPDDFIQRMLSAGLRQSEVRVVADQIGSPTPASELAQRLMRLADDMVGGVAKPPILHVAGAPPASRAEWVEFAFDTARGEGAALAPLRRVDSASIPTPARRPSSSALDTTLADAMFGASIDWRAATADVARRWAQAQVASS